MRVLVVDQFSEPGGAQQALLDLLPGLRERGWDAVVAMPGDGAMFEAVRRAGFAAERIASGPFTSGRKTTADVARFATQMPRVAGQLRAIGRGADVVLVNGPRLLPGVAMSGLRLPVVFHSHSYLPAGVMRSLAGNSLRRMRARVIANCEYVAAAWRGYAPTQVIYNGVDDVAAPARRDGRTVACIGRIAPEKGQLEFVEAARRVSGELPDCRFVVYGAALFGGAEYQATVRESARGLPVEFAGWSEDIAAALARTDVLLVPSTSAEATTRVILQAYAAGVPVVAFGSGGIPEVVEDGRTGLLARSVEEMASAAVQLLRDEARRRAMSAVARECWERRFTLARYRSEVLETLEAAARR